METALHVGVDSRGAIHRRNFLRFTGAGLASSFMLNALNLNAAELRKQGKSCIMLWMAGGPSQFETFDPKPGADTQGSTKAIATSVPGIQVADRLPLTAKIMKELCLIRSMTSKEGNHGRASYLCHTGYPPSGGVIHPGFGASVTKEIGDGDSELPGFVSISGPSQGPSFLGVKYAPYIVSDPSRPPDNLAMPVSAERTRRRLAFLEEYEGPSKKGASGKLIRDHRELYKQAARMALSARAKGFELEHEPAKVRDAYGRSAFGQGCLMARRLVEQGVTFIEVQASGWDTHSDELKKLNNLCPPVDQGLAALVMDLKERGLLDRTLVVWMGEFGRTPLVNLTAGRDHYPNAFPVVMAGMKVKKGYLHGATDKRGIDVTAGAVQVPDLFWSFCKALGVNPERRYESNVGRPVNIVDKGKAVDSLFQGG